MKYFKFNNKIFTLENIVGMSTSEYTYTDEDLENGDCSEDEVEEVLEKNAHLGLYQMTDLSKVRFHSDVDLYDLTKKGNKVFDKLRGLKESEPITLINFLHKYVAVNGEVKLYPQEKKYKVLDLIYNTPEEVDLSSEVRIVTTNEHLNCVIIEVD